MSSNTADEAIKRIHLKAIQNKIDENAYEIVNTTARCAIYEWDDKGWQKTGIEGSLFIFKFKHNKKSLANRNDSAAENGSDTDGLAMAILNKTNTDTVKLELNNQVEVKKSEPYLMYFNKKSHGDQIVGIWFNDTFSFLQATQIITSHLNQLKKSDVVKSDGKKSNNTAAIADSDKHVKNKQNLKKEGKSKDKFSKDKSSMDISKVTSPKVSSKTNGVKIESSPKTGSSKTKMNGNLKLLEKRNKEDKTERKMFKEDTTEEDLITIMSAKPGNSILENNQPHKKTTSEKSKKPKKNSNRSRSDSKGSASLDIITDSSGLKPNEPLIVHQLFSNLGASKSVDKVQKKRNGSASSEKNGETKPDILAMLQFAETKSFSRISSHEEKPSAESQENGLNLLASLSERLVEPPSTCSGAESGQTPKRKNKNKNKIKTENNNFEKSKLLTPKTLQPKALEYPTSDNDHDDAKKPTSKLLSPQVFKNKNTFNKKNSHDAPTSNLFKNNSQAVKTPLTQLLLGKKNQFIEDEPSYGSTPPAITAETSENEDHEASTRITSSFAEAESQESQDNSTLSRENLRLTMIQLLTNDDRFVDQIHAAYLSGLNKY